MQKPPSEGIAVVVIDAGGRPMAGVSLLVVDVEKARASQQLLEQVQEELIKKHPGPIEMRLVMSTFYSTRYVTGAKGEVTIPANRRETRVLAVHGEALATDVFEAGCKSAEIRFPITDPIHVLVVDSNGTPVAGVPLGLSEELGRAPPMLSERRGVTDDSGRAAVDRRTFMQSHPGAPTKFQVVAQIVSDEVVGVRVDPRSFRTPRRTPCD